MRFVLCDDDVMLCSMVDATIATHGHDVVGVADTTSAAVRLVEYGKPDVVVVDPSVGCNTDFDVIDTAIGVGAKVIVFSRNGGAPTSGRYDPKPLFVAKPDLQALEQAIGRLRVAQIVSDADRRRRPMRAPDGPRPSGPRDAAGFYAALNEAVEGDAFVAITAADGDAAVDLQALGEVVGNHLREADRDLMLITTSSLLVLLLGGGQQGIESVFNRVHNDPLVPSIVEFRSVVVGPGEDPTDAFDRLKHGGDSVH